MAQTVPCPKCGHQNDASQRFCGSCGGSLLVRCPSCETENPAGFRFCGSCGTALTPRVARADAAAEERRWATVLFADLSGFTSLSEHMDPEDVRSLIDRCMRKMGAVVEQAGGHVARIIGDELMAFFGAPVAHGDDTERAVRAALDLQRCARENREEFGGLSLRVGVNTGEMMMAPVGPESRRDPTVYGDAVNVAKRLETAAPIGGVFVGEETFRATRRRIRYEAVAPVAAKGKTDPVPAWRALAVLEGVAEVAPGPFVGRETELALLRGTWERVVEERGGRLVTILGPPGIGKTRLTREFTRSVEAAGGQALSGRSLPYGESTGYGAFARQVKAASRILETDPAATARAKLEQLCTSLGEADATQLAAHLALVIGISPEGGADKQVLFFAARRFVEALAQQRPTLLVFEDLHWADPSLFELVEFLALRVQDAPAMFLTLARPELLERRPGWGGGAAPSTVLPLDPLGRRDSIRLCAQLSGMAADDETVGRVADAAGGNPLFVEELAVSVQDRDATSDLPANVRAAIGARIDALAPDARSVLLDASVVGKAFWRGALAGEDGARIDEALDALAARDFIRREPGSRIEGDVEYVFKHILVREVAYGTLPRAARRERHAAVARFLVDAIGDRTADSASLLAHHWREAGDDERALLYLVAAAENARRAWAKGESVSLFAQALDMLGTDDPRRTGIRIRRATVQVEAGDLVNAASELDELMPTLTGREKLEASIVRARAAFWLMDGAGARENADRSVELAEQDGADDLRGPALAVSSQAHSLDGRIEEALVEAHEAIAGWQEGAHPDAFAYHIESIALFEYWLGRYEAAVAEARRAYRLSVETQVVEAVLRAGGQLVMGLTGLGRVEEALRMSDELTARGRELELSPRWTSRAINMTTWAHRDVFEWDVARRLNQEAIELGERAAFPMASLQAGIDLLFSDLAQGDVGSAERAWPGLRERAEQAKGWHQWLTIDRLIEARAEIAFASGRFEEAVAFAIEAREHARSYGRRKYQVAAQHVLGRSLLALDKRSDAAEELRSAAELAGQLVHPPTIWTVSVSLAGALAAGGDDDGAAKAAARAHDAIGSFAAALSDERRARFLGADPIAEALALGR